MAGVLMTSTLAVTEKDQPSPCLRSKMVTASVAIPMLSGSHHLPVGMLLTVMPCSLISHSKRNSKTIEQVKRYNAIMTGDLVMVTET
jgi:hypothetical protein